MRQGSACVEGKLYEQGARILGLEAGDGRGDFVGLASQSALLVFG